MLSGCYRNAVRIIPETVSGCYRNMHLQTWYFLNSSFTCPIPSSSCVFIYLRITSSFIPTVETKYPLPQMPFLSQYTFFKKANFLLRDLLVFFLMVSTTLITAYFGGITIANIYGLSLFLSLYIPNQDNISLFPEVLFSDNFLLWLLKSFFGIELFRQYDIGFYIQYEPLYIISCFRHNKHERKKTKK